MTGLPPTGPDPSYPPHGQPYPAYGGYAAPDHPQANLVLVLGILGLVLCGVLAPIAWVMGNRVVREIDESHGRVGGRSSANAGRVCGIVGTVFLALAVLAVLAVVVFVAAGVLALA